MKNALRRLVAQRLLQPKVKKLIKTYNLQVIAVGGSVGKTSTKHAIAAVLESKYPGQVLAHPGNFNTEISLPLSIFELPIPKTLINPVVWLGISSQMERIIQSGAYRYKVLVLELGIDHPGEMAAFMRYLQPDIGVVTAIAPEHLDQLHDMETVAREEFLLAQKSKKAVLNAEDPILMKLASGLRQTPVLYGPSGMVRFEDGFELITRLGQVKVRPQVLGDHSLLAVLAASAVAQELGATLPEIAAGIGQIYPSPGRMVEFTGLKGARLIDDTYNASPQAVKAALTFIYRQPGRKIAILGSMNELGTYSQAAHEEVGKYAYKLDLLVTIGTQAQDYLAPAAIKAGLAETRVKSFLSPYDAGVYVRSIIQAGDIVLVKGSQNAVFSEEALKLLLADPADSVKLVRQSPEWINKKKAQFGVQ